MKIRMVATALLAAGLLVAALGSVAEARNPSCSGGILYVSQALQAREKKDDEEFKKLAAEASQRSGTKTQNTAAPPIKTGRMAWSAMNTTRRP